MNPPEAEKPLPVQNKEEIDLTRSRFSIRALFNIGMNTLAAILTLIALILLFSVLYLIVIRGGARLNLALFYELPPAAGMEGGGIANALLGTLIMVGIASLLSVPMGILSAVYLSELGKKTLTARLGHFGAKVLSGVPSILMGVFIYALIVVGMKQFSAIAGGVALAVLMLPIVILATEKALLQVPRNIREASYGLGATTTQTVLRVVLPAAAPSILTAVMLSVSRAAGETAPLLFTALFSNYFIRSLNQPTASMAVLIYNYSSMPYQNMIDLAWAASFILILFVLLANIISHFAIRQPKR